MSIITGTSSSQHEHITLTKQYVGIWTGDNVHLKFKDLYDGTEHAHKFTGSKQNVPTEPETLTDWLAVNTIADEANVRSQVAADVVYATEPTQRVVVRVKGIVTDVTLESSRYADHHRNG